MIADSEQRRDGEPKSRIFISYSRKDMVFADRLEAALKARGFEPLIDRTEIHAFEDWWERIKTLIGSADTVVSVLSPDAVASKICVKEVAYAASLNKRFAPIVCRRVKNDAVPKPLRRLNFVFLDNYAHFEVSVDRLAEGLETDIEWIRRHTQFGEFALRWEAAGCPGPGGLMLRPPLLSDAEAWLGLRPRNAPEPTEIVRAFIAKSREAFDQEQAAIVTSQVNLLAQLGYSEHLRGNFDVGLKLSVHAARRHLESQKGISSPSGARATLAAVVSQTGWRLLLSGHQNDVSSAAFSPDGARIVTASSDKTARIWDAATGREITVLPHKSSVHSAAFSSDGARIVTATLGANVAIWDAATGREITVLQLSSQNSVKSVAFSPDGARIVTAGGDRSTIWDTEDAACIWNATTGRQIMVLRHERYVESAAFSPDGGHIVTASRDETARIWDAASGREIKVLRGHQSKYVNSAAFGPDGARIVTASSDETARVWDAASGREITVLRGHQSDVQSAAFSPDGARIVTASSDKTARIWDAASGREIAVLRGHEGGVRSAAFSPDGGHIVTASRDETARIWDAASGREIAVLRGHESGVHSAAFSPDGARIVTASSDKQRASGTPPAAGKSRSCAGTRIVCSPLRLARTARASSPHRGTSSGASYSAKLKAPHRATKQRASGTPSPVGKLRSCGGTIAI
jgi:WD40 repeat protein